MAQGKNDQDNRKHTADSRNPEWDNYAPDGHGRTDEQIRADVHEALRGEADQPPAGVSVSVGDGIVTLSGQIEDAGERRRLAELVRAVPSVKDVRDQLRGGN